MIDTLVIDDDFRVAGIHAACVASVAGFNLVGVVHRAADAIDIIERVSPDLLLLDLYLPDQGGLDVLRHLNSRTSGPSVIVISAASDHESVREARRLGAVSYIAKPFHLDMLRGHLRDFQTLHDTSQGVAVSDSSFQLPQDAIDQIYKRGSSSNFPKDDRTTPDWWSPTATNIMSALADNATGLSAREVADRVGVSRATAQRHLAWMERAGNVKLILQYGRAGRPEHRFVRNEH